MIYQSNLHYSLLVEGLFRYNVHFTITLFSLGSHHERYNKVVVYMYNIIMYKSPEWRHASADDTQQCSTSRGCSLASRGMVHQQVEISHDNS